MKDLSQLIDELLALDLGLCTEKQIAFNSKIFEIKKHVEVPIIIKELNNINISKSNSKLFGVYLKNKKLKDSSIKKYFIALDKIKEFLEFDYHVYIKNQLYVIDDQKCFCELIEVLETNKKIVSVNIKWHHLLSAAYNKFLNQKQVTI